MCAWISKLYTQFYIYMIDHTVGLGFLELQRARKLEYSSLLERSV